MNRLASDSGFGDLRIVAVGVDRERSDARKFLRRYETRFAVVWDGEGDTPAAYDVGAMPSSYLIDPDGIVRHIHLGFRADDKQALRDKLASVMAKEGE